MSAFGTKQTFRDRVPMSAFGGKADIGGAANPFLFRSFIHIRGWPDVVVLLISERSLCPSAANEAARVHYAFRQHCNNVAARGARQAARKAADYWVHGLGYGCS